MSKKFEPPTLQQRTYHFVRLWITIAIRINRPTGTIPRRMLTLGLFSGGVVCEISSVLAAVVRIAGSSRVAGVGVEVSMDKTVGTAVEVGVNKTVGSG